MCWLFFISLHYNKVTITSSLKTHASLKMLALSESFHGNPTMHYFRIPRHTQSMIAYRWAHHSVQDAGKESVQSQDNFYIREKEDTIWDTLNIHHHRRSWSNPAKTDQISLSCLDYYLSWIETIGWHLEFGLHLLVDYRTSLL